MSAMSGGVLLLDFCFLTSDFILLKPYTNQTPK